MKNMTKRWIAFLLSFVIILSSLYIPVFSVDSGYPTEYSSEYNSGDRDELCITLDGTSAYDYYTGNYSYENLESLSANDLKTALNKLMTSTHSYISSYNDCHYKADRTDCENEDGRVLLVYTSYSATMSQWNGWNREHVWPQSLGGNNTSGGGADMHHIRPSDAVVNSTRGNKKYGNIDGGTAKYGNNPASGYLGGYYDSTYFEPLDNVKGDVARIILYVWVRWGTNWGAESVTEVFQSVDVLLEWCELDPVDTWEMGRNEVIEDIQGNRNVFIDYPELAWLVFGKDVPAGMTTPSGNALGDPNCEHTNTELRNVKAATCTTNGHTGDICCVDCNRTVTRGTTIPATNHSNAYLTGAYDPDCTNKGYTGDKYCPDCKKNIATGSSIPATNHPNKYTVGATSPTCTTEGHTGSTYCPDCNKTIVAGSVIAATNHANAYIINAVSATCKSEGYTGDKYCPDCKVIIAYGSVIAVTTHVNFVTKDKVEPTCSSEGYSGDKYCSDCGVKVESGTSIPITDHKNTEIKNSVQESCAADGYTGDTYCKDCGAKVAEGQSIPKNDNHSFGQWTLSEDGVTYKKYCSVCGVYEIYTVDMLIAELGSDAEIIIILLSLGVNSDIVLDALTK